MKRLLFFLPLFFIILETAAVSQADYPGNRFEEDGNTEINFFIRSGAYFSRNITPSSISIPSAYSDIALRIAHDNRRNVKILSDLRFRYGTEFNEPVERGEIRELFIKLNGSSWELSAGKQIIKWGRSDFSYANSKLASKDPFTRSPDFEDMDLGNIVLDMKWSPLPFLTMELAGMPFYRPSRLITDAIEIPDYVDFAQPEKLLSGKGMQSYGLRVNINTGRAVINLSWFDGNEPLPGIALGTLSIDTSQAIPLPDILLEAAPYRIKNLGLDIETVIDRYVIRGELTCLMTSDNTTGSEYVARDELTWTAGLDLNQDDWRITAEYSGKYVPDYEPSGGYPIIGRESDPGQLALLFSLPGLDPVKYLKTQIASFNRLYTYQQHKFNHTAGISVEKDMFFGKLIPSIKTLYNFTTADIALIGELRYKPLDGLTIAAGGEFYSGKKGSVHDIISDFMNCVRISARYDF